jgi:hypothetical protein
MLNYFFIKRLSGIAINIEISKNNGMFRCGSTLDLVFTGGHLPSIIHNGCYYSDHMTLLIEKKIQ